MRVVYKSCCLEITGSICFTNLVESNKFNDDRLYYHYVSYESHKLHKFPKRTNQNSLILVYYN